VPRKKGSYVDVECGYCQKVGRRLRWHVKRSKELYCDRECHNNAKRGKKRNVLIELVCDFCGRCFLRPRAVHKKGKGKFCSTVCRNKNTTRMNRKGKRELSEFTKFNNMRKILNKKLQVCSICFCAPKVIHFHHIVPRRMRQDHSPSNITPLCPSCHSRIDTFMDRFLLNFSGDPYALKRHLSKWFQAREHASVEWAELLTWERNDIIHFTD